ncbi:hypothetical protein [Microlunatus sp. GCM10028923]|uniref:hypothetical protein n=1 Tax=Microlunatus sp. GCM10028923 TaxID=3273400 RepID=UPI00361D97BC
MNPLDPAEALAYEARISAQVFQSMTDRLRDRPTLPGPDLALVIADLAIATERLWHLCGQLSAALANQEADQGEGADTDQARSIARARRHLDSAADGALDLSSWLTVAHGAIRRAELPPLPWKSTATTTRKD